MGASSPQLDQVLKWGKKQSNCQNNKVDNDAGFSARKRSRNIFGDNQVMLLTREVKNVNYLETRVHNSERTDIKQQQFQFHSCTRMIAHIGLCLVKKERFKIY